MDLAQARTLFETLTTTQLCDVTPHIRVIAAGIHAFSRETKCLGLALTVRADGDLMPMLKSLELATSDHVIVVDSGNSPFALAGELMANEARRKNIAGIVLDGYCRDSKALYELGLPFFAKGTHPQAGSKKLRGELNSPIQCGGVRVSSGDVVLCDEDGIVVLNQSEITHTFSLAKNIVEREERILSQITKGTSLLALSNFTKHYDHLQLGNDSAFKWLI